MDELIEMLFGWQTCVNPALLVVFTGVDIPLLRGTYPPGEGHFGGRHLPTHRECAKVCVVVMEPSAKLICTCIV